MAPAPIFITARFRSGSTMLWDIFRASLSHRAYYEPCHDNLVANINHVRPQESHRGVVSYWEEYRPHLEEIARRHDNAFGVTRLLLEETDAYPRLESYLRWLTELDSSRTPVLQCNRIDFRLPWLRARFPEARIVHLQRDPRDSWFSMVRHNPPQEWDDPDHPLSYDLGVWAWSLSKEFPFLVGPEIRTSYDRHYLIWKLSSLMGARLADCSLSYDEDFQEDPERGLRRLIEVDGRLAEHAEAGRSRIADTEKRLWAEHRDETWFKESESRLTALLERLGLLQAFGKAPLAEIEAKHESEWRRVREAAANPSGAPMVMAFSRYRSDCTELMGHHQRAVQHRDDLQRELDLFQTGRIWPLVRRIGELVAQRVRSAMGRLPGMRRHGNE